MLKESIGRLNPTSDTHVNRFDYTQCSLRNEKLKTNRASETEEQRKERMRIRREKDRVRRKRKTTRNSSWPFSKDSSEVMKLSWRES